MATIDYITVSVPFEVGEVWEFPKHEAFEIAMQTRATSRYEYTYITKVGMMISIPSEKNRRQKCLIEMTGDACSMSRALELQDTKLLQWLMLEAKGKFSRLDIAFDTSDPTSWAQRLLWEWRWKQAKTRITEEPRFYQKENGGETYYFGSASSNRELRVYDKAAEMNLLAGIITRVELQSRKDSAQHLVGQVLEMNNLDWVAARTIKDFIDFPEVRWYQELLKSGGLKLEKLGRKKTDFQKWWKEDIEKVFRNHYRDNRDGDRMFLKQSLDRMKDIIRRYDEKGDF